VPVPVPEFGPVPEPVLMCAHGCQVDLSSPAHSFCLSVVFFGKRVESSPPILSLLHSCCSTIVRLTCKGPDTFVCFFSPLAFFIPIWDFNADDVDNDDDDDDDDADDDDVDYDDADGDDDVDDVMMQELCCCCNTCESCLHLRFLWEPFLVFFEGHPRLLERSLCCSSVRVCASA
jgi:hypothetical protein